MITVATYNIHKAHSMRGCHLNELKNGLKEMNADLICLQEVQDRNSKRKSSILTEYDQSQVAALQANLYPHIAYGANAIYDHGHHGNAILSKYPIQQWRNIDVSDHRLEQRGILHATLDHPQLGEVHVINSHFGLFKGSRVRQAQALIQHVRESVPKHAPLIVAGDFNATEDEAGIRHLLDAHPEFMRLQPENDGPTHPDLSRAVDHIFFFPRSRLVDYTCWIDTSDLSRRASDHLPVVAELQIR